MKSYTDIEQSKKLADILPIESADMRYGYVAPYDFSDRMYDGGYDEVPYPKDFLLKNPNFSANEYDGELPAWSFAALWKLLPNFTSLGKEEEGTNCGFDFHFTKKYDNPIDAAFEMICWLKENNKI